MTPSGFSWGEIASLLAALSWAVAVILFRRSGEHVHPLGLNLFKTLLAALLFLPTMWLCGVPLARPVPAGEVLLMLASGVLGIGLGDTFFFLALNSLGAGRIAVVDCLYSPFIIGLSMWWLGERLRPVQVVGVLLIVSAVLAVTREGRSLPAERRALARGVLCGIAALATMAVGIVMVKPLLERSPLLWATELRLLGGAASLALLVLVHPGRRAILTSIRSPQRWSYTVSGSFVGAYLSLLFWLAGMKYAPASVSSALNQTSNIFIFLLAALVLRERITPIRLAGIILGVGGAFLVMFG